MMCGSKIYSITLTIESRIQLYSVDAFRADFCKKQIWYSAICTSNEAILLYIHEKYFIWTQSILYSESGFT